MGWLTYTQARTTQRFEPFGSGEQESVMDAQRLEYRKVEGASVILSYMADDKTHVGASHLSLPILNPVQKEPIEALLRSVLLVFMDNSTSEYIFIKSFFSMAKPLTSQDSMNAIFSPSLLSPDEQRSVSGSEHEGRSRSNSLQLPPSPSTVSVTLREEHPNFDAIWKQVLEPVMEYIQVRAPSCYLPPVSHLHKKFGKSLVDPVPPVITLLTMIRCTEDVVAEIDTRGCPPGVSFVFSVALQMWPIFQKAMTDHIDSLKKLAAGGSSGYFGRSTSLTDASVATVRPASDCVISLNICPGLQPLYHDVLFFRLLDATRRGNNYLCQVYYSFSLICRGLNSFQFTPVTTRVIEADTALQ